MNFLFVLFILKWASLSAALSLLILKYGYILMIIKIRAANAKSKWLGWYRQNELMTINCPRTWEIMLQTNRVTTAFWVCFSLYSILLLTTSI